jgi:hypothetical protein
MKLSRKLLTQDDEHFIFREAAGEKIVLLSDLSLMKIRHEIYRIVGADPLTWIQRWNEVKPDTILLSICSDYWHEEIEIRCHTREFERARKTTKF